MINSALACLLIIGSSGPDSDMKAGKRFEYDLVVLQHVLLSYEDRKVKYSQLCFFDFDLNYNFYKLYSFKLIDSSFSKIRDGNNNFLYFKDSVSGTTRKIKYKYYFEYSSFDDLEVDQKKRTFKIIGDSPELILKKINLPKIPRRDGDLFKRMEDKLRDEHFYHLWFEDVENAIINGVSNIKTFFNDSILVNFSKNGIILEKFL